MPLFREDHNRTIGADGKIVDVEVIQFDITAEAIEYDLHDRARRALVRNRADLAAVKPATQAARIAELEARVDRLTRQTNALLKLVVGGDLLRDETADT